MRERETLDLAIDPPPDLAIEVDVTHSSMDRLTIYAALGVQEVWHHRESGLRVLLRNTRGVYEESPTSRAFPLLPLRTFGEKMHKPGKIDETTWIRSFRAWVRTLAPHDARES